MGFRSLLINPFSQYQYTFTFTILAFMNVPVSHAHMYLQIMYHVNAYTGVI